MGTGPRRRASGSLVCGCCGLGVCAPPAAMATSALPARPLCSSPGPKHPATPAPRPGPVQFGCSRGHVAGRPGCPRHGAAPPQLPPAPALLSLPAMALCGETGRERLRGCSHWKMGRKVMEVGQRRPPRAGGEWRPLEGARWEGSRGGERRAAHHCFWETEFPLLDRVRSMWELGLLTCPQTYGSC